MSAASSTSRRSRWLTADRLTPRAAARVSRSASGMRRRIAAVSPQPPAEGRQAPVPLEARDGRELPFGGAHGPTEVRLLRIQEAVQAGAHVAADTVRLQLEDAAVRPDEAQEGGDLLVSLQVDDVAAAPLGDEAPNLQVGEGAAQISGSSLVAQHEFHVRSGGAERDRSGGQQHAPQERASVVEQAPAPTTIHRRWRSRSRPAGGGVLGRLPGPAAGRGGSTAMPSDPARWTAVRAVAWSRVRSTAPPFPCSRPTSSARRQQDRAGWMRASSPFTSPARSTDPLRRRVRSGAGCGAAAVARSGPPAGGA